MNDEQLFDYLRTVLKWAAENGLLIEVVQTASNKLKNEPWLKIEDAFAQALYDWDL